MSILLDALTREKQQQQTVKDVVMQPVMPTTQAKAGLASYRMRKVAWLLLAVSGGVAAAWGLNWMLQPAQPSSNPSAHSNTQDVASVSTPNTANVDNHGADRAEVASVNTTQSTSNIRLAGKVALPIAQPMEPVVAAYSNQQIRQTRVIDQSSSNDSTASNRPENLLTGDVASDDSELSLALLQQLSNEYDLQQGDASVPSRQSASRNNTAPSSAMEAEAESEPIILGANANQRGKDELATLRLQVNHAANEVNFSQVKREQQAQDNLMQAFEAALRDVEYERSATADVTAPELNPIPKTVDKVLPSYGELPASLQLKVPQFNIMAHVYASDPTQRWLNVDGAEMQQGDKIKGMLTIIEIRPRDVILDIEGTEFKVPAI